MAEYTDYIARLPAPAAVTVETFRSRALEIVPAAEEGMSYGMVALRYRGRPLVSVVATKAGYSVYPFSSDVVASVLPALDGFAATKGGIAFTDAHPLPTAVFDRMLRERQAEIDAALGPAGDGRGDGPFP